MTQEKLQHEAQTGRVIRHRRPKTVPPGLRTQLTRMVCMMSPCYVQGAWEMPEHALAAAVVTQGLYDEVVGFLARKKESPAHPRRADVRDLCGWCGFLGIAYDVPVRVLARLDVPARGL